MFAYETKVNEKDALIINKGDKKEDNAEVIALIEGDEGKLELFNGLLSDGEVLKSLGDIALAIEGMGVEILEHFTGDEILTEWVDWFNANYVFIYNDTFNGVILFESTGETATDIKVPFGDETVIGSFEIWTNPETGEVQIGVGSVYLDGDETQTDISR